MQPVGQTRDDVEIVARRLPGLQTAEEDAAPVETPVTTPVATPAADEPPDFQLVIWKHSKALGKWYAKGRLVNGTQLPELGEDFFTWDPVYNRIPNRPWRRYGTDRLIRTILTVLHAYRTEHDSAQRVGIMDLSRTHGGVFGNTCSTQNLLISRLPTSVCPGPTVNVPFGAQRLIISAMSLLEMDLCQFLSILSMSKMPREPAWATEKR